MISKQCKQIVTIVAAVGAVVLAYFGIRWYSDYRARMIREAADRLAIRFYEVCGKGVDLTDAQKTNLVAVLNEIDALLPKCRDYGRDELLTRRLDGAFMLGDYATAAQLIRIVPGYDDRARESLSAKLLAHDAEDRGDFACAFSNYTIFVEATLRAPADEVEQIDPFTDVTWTKNAVLAHNKKRLAGLAKKLGRADEAEKLMAEAKAYYAEAIKEADGDTKTIEAMKEDEAK